LSGNTDLLDKAKIEKQIAGLESEKRAFNRSKSVAKYKLKDFTHTLESSQSRLNRMSLDWNSLQKRLQKRSDGSFANPVLLEGLAPNPTIKQIGTKLNQIKEKARTFGEYEEIGSLYGFNLLVKTELSEKDGMDIKLNRFFAQGEGNIKYTYNNGILAKDPKLAATNFLKALEKLPGFIEQEEKRISEINKDLPVLQEVVNGTWPKEDRLNELKTKLAGIERKIQLSIAPNPEEKIVTSTNEETQVAPIIINQVEKKDAISARSVL